MRTRALIIALALIGEDTLGEVCWAATTLRASHLFVAVTVWRAIIVVSAVKLLILKVTPRELRWAKCMRA